MLSLHAGLAVITWLGCAPEAARVDTAATEADPHTLELPDHNTCLPDGEKMSEEVCVAFLEEDGRVPTVAHDYSDGSTEDPRADDPDMIWLHEQVERCTCSCCHSSSLGGCGVHRWDLDFEPVWLDSMSSWSMMVFAGINRSESQFLPVEDVERVEEIIRSEKARRDELGLD